MTISLKNWQGEEEMTVRVDRDECISCGVCWSECPELYIEDTADGKTSIASEYRIDGDASRGQVPETLAAGAQAGADSCPVSCIHIE